MSDAVAIRSSLPAADEHVPYFGTYLAHVTAGDLIPYLARNGEQTLALLRGIPEGRGGHRYAEGKWSIREVIGHVMDTERIFAHRAMRFSRGDETPLPSFDENAYVANAKFDARTIASLADELASVRQATLRLFESFDAEEWLRRGKAGAGVISVRALGWITAGHELHHVGLLRSRYLSDAN